MKIDLDEMERKARHEVERVDRSDAVDEWVATPEEALALVEHIRELEAAVRSALRETDNHNREYRYVTPAELMQSWRDLLEKGAVLP